MWVLLSARLLPGDLATSPGVLHTSSTGLELERSAVRMSPSSKRGERRQAGSSPLGQSWRAEPNPIPLPGGICLQMPSLGLEPFISLTTLHSQSALKETASIPYAREQHPEPGAIRGQPAAPGPWDRQGSKRGQSPGGHPGKNRSFLLNSTVAPCTWGYRQTNVGSAIPMTFGKLPNSSKISCL